MNWAASRMARYLWKWMLWLMRRPWMKQLQRWSYGLFPRAIRARAVESMISQNKWARRFGLTILTFSLNIFLGTMIVSAMYVSALYLQLSGVFEPTDRAVHFASKQ